MILSDRGIKQLMKEGHLKIEPFDESRLGSISYDLAAERLYQRRWDRKPLEGMPFDEFLEECCAPLDEFILEPGKHYFAASQETVSFPTIRTNVITRSSLARCGVGVETEQEQIRTRNGRVPLVIKTYNTRVRIPSSYPIAQMFSETGLPLKETELRSALNKREIQVDGEPHIIQENQTVPRISFGYMPSTASVLLHFGPVIKRYKGGTIDITQDTSGHFEDIDITNGYVMRPGDFYLAYVEDISLDRKHAGLLMRLFDDFGNAVHTNAPLVQPESKGTQVLEISVNYPKMVMAGRPICRMELHALDQEPEKSYADIGRYADQNGPVTSRSHLDFV